MNTKKNKNKSKQNKPNPQQKSEITAGETQLTEPSVKVEEKVEVQDKPEVVKSEQNVPIASETVTPILEAKAIEGDTPKKPKRNRGKKKKADQEEDFDDNAADKPTELLAEEVKNLTENLEVKQTEEKCEEKPADTQEVTPAARKKKNKNKKQSEHTEKFEELNLAPLSKEELADVKIITCVPVVSETDESKTKKKNKKKKRSDSERSDKAEEIVACTAAFQKLLDSGEKKEVKKDITSEDQKTDLVEDPNKELPKKQPPKLEEKNIEEVALTSDDKEQKDGQKDDGTKGKKKNKKDKKHPAKTEDQDTKPIESSTDAKAEIKQISSLLDVHLSEELTTKDAGDFAVENLELPVIPKAIEKEKSPKLKAKIAKPVEKKRKGKTDSSSTENLADKDADSIKVEEKTIVDAEIPKVRDAIKVEDDVKPMDVGLTNVKESDILSSATSAPDAKVVETMSEIKQDIPATSDIKIQPTTELGSGKKGKKGKSKQTEITETKEHAINVESKSKADDKIESRSVDVLDIRPITPIAKQELETEAKTENVETKQSSKLEIDAVTPKVAIPLSFETVIPAEAKVSATPKTTDIPEEHLPVKKEMPKAELSVGTDSSKKRKKSPKRPKAAEKSDLMKSVPEKIPAPILEDIPNPIETEQTEVLIETTTETPKDISEELQKSMIGLPPLEEIDIRSVKTEESEGSVCDITPDVHYPRASSQSQDDNNNTTTIQDVTATVIPDGTLNIPIVLPDTPLIQGSGETPCPELIPCGVTFTEIEPTTSSKTETATKIAKHTEAIVKPKTEEKTDLKSKVLDVNQGMEELRKSIERSLAELSAIEKNEKDAEEHFARAQSKLEEIQDLALKRSEEKKDTSKTKKEDQVLTDQKSEISKTETQKNAETKQSVSKSTEKPTELSKPIENIQETKIEIAEIESQPTEIKPAESAAVVESSVPPPPPLPARKDNKGKSKKKKGKHDTEQSTTSVTPSSTTTEATSSTSEPKEAQKSKNDEKSEQKSEKTDNQGKGKQQSAAVDNDDSQNNTPDCISKSFEPIENFEDAMTSSMDDVNKTFEIIAEEASQIDPSQNPEINITAPIEDDEKEDTKNDKQEKNNPVSQPKNLLGHPDIPARLNKTDYKKEKDKTPNLRSAKVKVKDAVPVEVTKESKESQTENKRRFLKDRTASETISSVMNNNEEYVYKYSFRKVFLPSACHVCKKDLKPTRIPCSFCNLVFYCNAKHKDEDYTHHQALCFAVSTVVHLKEQKHIYEDAKNITGQDYRLLRMQMIVSCEKVLKRRLVPWEQEALLYPRLCADAACREWRQNKLVDCAGCGQIAYCSENPDHLPKSHQRWCKSYSLYHRLVVHQQTKGRLEPKLPTRVMAELYQIPEKLNEVLASMYEEKIDMTDIQYAALTQIATAPLTAAYCQQLFTTKMNGIYANGTHKKSSFTIHVVGAELQFEADALCKWEVFFLHLRPDVKDLRVVLIGPDLNPSKLPLDLLGKIKLCENCRLNKRRVVFEFQDHKTYHEYFTSDFSTPDLVCAFNPSIQRSSACNGKDTWPSTIKCIMKLRVPFIITSYTMSELVRDIARVKSCSETELGIISEPKYNAFASVRPDRNFISDDEMPLLFKNFCFSVVCGSI